MFGIGKCRGCQAKDDEIRHLLTLLTNAQTLAEKAQARLAEVLSPGAERRVVIAHTPPRPPTAGEATMAAAARFIERHRRPGLNFPDYPERSAPEPPPIADEPEGAGGKGA